MGRMGIMPIEPIMPILPIPEEEKTRGLPLHELLQLREGQASLKKNGGYLLSHLAGSTIGAGGLNFSVRDGKRWNPATIATLM